MAKRRQKHATQHNIDTSSDTSEFPLLSFHKVNKFPRGYVVASLSTTKSIKTHPAFSNTNVFPESLDNRITENHFLKSYIETKQPKHLFEAIEDDFRILCDPVVMETISYWREWLISPLAKIGAEGFPFLVDEQNLKDCEYLLRKIGQSLIPREFDKYYTQQCIENSGLIHKNLWGAKGRPSLELDTMARLPENPEEVREFMWKGPRYKTHPFVKFWIIIKFSIEQARPKTESGKKRIYRGDNRSRENKIRDYKPVLSKILGEGIDEKELTYFEWQDIDTITASTIAYILKSNCQFCRRIDTPNQWHTIYRIYKRAKRLSLFA